MTEKQFNRAIEQLVAAANAYRCGDKRRAFEQIRCVRIFAEQVDDELKTELGPQEPT